MDMLDDPSSILKPWRSGKGVAIDGISERTVQNMQIADELCGYLATRRNSSTHADSHSVSFIKMYLESVSTKIQSTVSFSLVDLASPSIGRLSASSGAAELRKTQRFQRCLSYE